MTLKLKDGQIDSDEHGKQTSRMMIASPRMVRTMSSIFGQELRQLGGRWRMDGSVGHIRLDGNLSCRDASEFELRKRCPAHAPEFSEHAG